MAYKKRITMKLLNFIALKIVPLFQMIGLTVYKWLDEFLILASAFMVTFFVPIWKFVIGIGILVFFDMIMAVIANYKLKKSGDPGRGVKSGKMFRTAWKFVVYAIPVVVAHLMVRLFKVPSNVPIVEGIAAFLCLIEVKSIDENFKLITGKSVFKQLIELFNKKKESNEK